jgi:hypothetical protein
MRALLASARQSQANQGCAEETQGAGLRGDRPKGADDVAESRWRNQPAIVTTRENSTIRRSKERSQSSIDYIEGWFTIAEANTIFGFDGWIRR